MCVRTTESPDRNCSCSDSNDLVSITAICVCMRMPKEMAGGALRLAPWLHYCTYQVEEGQMFMDG